MKEFSKIGVFCIILTLMVQHAFSQENTLPEGRYIVITNSATWFNEVNGYIEVRDFLLYNVDDDESSKPLFTEINEMSNIVKFSIGSSSEKIERTRRCTVIMNSDDYRNTFYKVLRKMQVKTVFVDGTAMSVEDFFMLINE
ncbi:MAG TPA: hypothetical protein PLP11_10415 [Bacteroidales bacterium]|nr:hypothetical protein [Bacteroidales bacterium]